MMIMCRKPCKESCSIINHLLSTSLTMILLFFVTFCESFYYKETTPFTWQPGDPTESAQEVFRRLDHVDKNQPFLSRYTSFKEAPGNHSATLIFLHGHGGTGTGWAPALAQLREPHIRIICPTGDIIPMTYKSDRDCAWYNIMAVKDEIDEDIEGILKAKDFVHGVIEKEIANGTASDRIILGGFSQGGALALFAGLTFPKRLAGIVAVSSWLPMYQNVSKYYNPVQKDIPILQCNGDNDDFVPFRLAQLSINNLKNISRDAKLKILKDRNEHTIKDEELYDIQKFMIEKIPLIEYLPANK